MNGRRFAGPWSRLEAERNELFEELSAYTPAQLNQNPEPGAWSVNQVLLHVMGAEQLSLRYLKKKLSHPGPFPPATLMTHLRTWSLLLATRLPLKVEAPAAISGENLPETADLGEIRTSWERLREEFAAFLEEQPPEVFRREVFRHPLAGKLTLQGMLAFTREHFRRHRRQIRRTLARIDQG